MAQTANNDPTVEVQYHTDPTERGFQILRNYESTYWRAFLGSDAWSLYEVLRSFCHNGNDSCRPTITTLTAILGIKDKRAIIGRTKRTKEKTYHYPGLIDQLGEYDLLTAETIGKGGALRYIFHLTKPPQLTEDQVKQLPEVLQDKHRRLLERCEKDKQELKAKHRRNRAGNKGVGNSHTSVGNSHTNNTQVTVPKVSSKKLGINNNNTGKKKEASKADLVVVLKSKGITESRAQWLSRFSADRIQDHIDLLEHLKKSRNGSEITNPAGWLYSAIRQNYLASGEYKDFQTRKQKAATEAKRQEAEKESQQRAAEQRELAEARAKQQEAEQRQRDDQLKTEWGTPPEIWECWPGIKADLLGGMAQITISTHLSDSRLLKADNGQAVIGVKTSLAQEWLERDGNYKTIQEILGSHLQQPGIDLKFVTMEQSRSNGH